MTTNYKNSETTGLLKNPCCYEKLRVTEHVVSPARVDEGTGVLHFDTSDTNYIHDILCDECGAEYSADEFNGIE